MFVGLLFVLTHFWTLRCFVKVFPSCIFPSLVNNIHIINLASIVPFSFEHFFFSWFLWGLWFSLASDRFNHLLVCLLVFFLPLIWFPYRCHQCFERPISICFLFLVAKNFRWKCWCKYIFKVKACWNNFWEHLSVFCSKTFLFVLFIPSFTSLLTPAYFFRCDFHASFLDCPQPPWCIVKLFSPFIVVGSTSFP
jgi:hypothetical protein